MLLKEKNEKGWERHTWQETICIFLEAHSQPGEYTCIEEDAKE